MSSKSNENNYLFSAPIFNIGAKSQSGNIYTQEIADRIILNVATGERTYKVEEVAPLDRMKNNVKPYESWNARAMAVCIDAKMENTNLVMTFKVYKNKHGKRLQLLLENNAIDKIDFYPVGIGNAGPDGVVTNYTLSYISFDIK